jgi:YVTN family beta-propeller protein
MYIRLRAALRIWMAAATASPFVPGLVEARPVGYVIDGAAGAITAIDIDRRAVAGRIPIALTTDPQNVKVAAQGTRVYVEGGMGVSVIDTTTDVVVDTITVPGCGVPQCHLTGVDVSRDGALLYITTFSSDPSSPFETVMVMAVATHRVVASIPVPPFPIDIAVGPNSRAYVAHTTSAVSVIDTLTNAISATILLSDPAVALTVLPDGRFVYVTTEGGIGRTMVQVIDTGTNTVIASIPVPLGALGIAVSPNGARVYVASIAGTVSVVDTATNKVVATVTVDRPERVTVSPNGAFAYVSNVAAGSVSIIDTATTRVVGSVPVGQAPVGLAFTSDGRSAYVVNFNSADVHVIDTAARTVRSIIRGGLSLLHVVVRPDGRFAYVTSFQSVPGTDPHGYALLVVDAAARRLAARITVDGSALAVSPDGGVLYVLGPTLALVDTATSVVTTSIALPGLEYPAALAVSPDGTQAFAVGNTFASSGGGGASWVRILTIDTAARAVTASLTLPGDGVPVSITVGPDGRTAYVSVEPVLEPPNSFWDPMRTPRPSAAGVVVLDIGKQEVVETIPIEHPQSVALRPDGIAYVANGSESVVVIDTADYHVLASVPVGGAQRHIALTADGASAFVLPFGQTIGVLDTASNSVAASIPLGGAPTDIAIGPGTGIPCPGDCSGDGHVTLDEIILAVNIALGDIQLAACSSVDADASGAVEIGDLVGAVHAALQGCPL